MITVHAVTAHRVWFSAIRPEPFSVVVLDEQGNSLDLVLSTAAAVSLAAGLKMCLDAASCPGITEFSSPLRKEDAPIMPPKGGR